MVPCNERELNARVEKRYAGAMTINSRELHGEIGISKQYSKWMLAMIKRFSLVDGVDYTVTHQHRKKEKTGKPSIIYLVTEGVADRLRNTVGTLHKHQGVTPATSSAPVPEVMHEGRLAPENVRNVTYRGQRVVTFADVDRVHGRPKGTAKRNFNEHREHFEEGRHFYLARWDEIRTIGLTDSSEANRRDMYLLTEFGYMLLAKSLQDPLAWRIQEKLVESYFRKGGMPSLDDPKAWREAALTYSAQVIELKEENAAIAVERDHAKIKMIEHQNYRAQQAPIARLGREKIREEFKLLDEWCDERGLSMRKVRAFLKKRGVLESTYKATKTGEAFIHAIYSPKIREQGTLSKGYDLYLTEKGELGLNQYYNRGTLILMHEGIRAGNLVPMEDASERQVECVQTANGYKVSSVRKGKPPLAKKLYIGTSAIAAKQAEEYWYSLNPTAKAFGE